jgi:hypothetical protein
MSASSPLTIFRSPAWPSLAQRLDAAVAAEPRLARARDALLRPVRLLASIAADAPLALGDDALAAERVRTVLCLAAPWKDLDHEAAAMLRSHRTTSPYQPGILHHGALVIVALAAMRVTPRASDARDAVRTVLGLALATSPVEVIGRSDPRQPGSVDVGTILGILSARRALGEPKPEVLQPFAADPAERGRWRCLIALLGGDLVPKASAARPWDGAYADPIDEVEPWGTRPGGVRLVGRFKAEKRLLDKKALSVIQGSADRPPVAATLVKALADSIEVKVSEAVAPGWLGFSSREKIDDSNAFRERVRDLWRERSRSRAGAPYREALRDAPVPVDAIPSLGPDLSAPPRGAGNRLVSGRPLFRGAAPLAASPAMVMTTLTSVVLVRPSVLRDGAPVSVSSARVDAVLWAVASDVQELPWLDDPLAVLSSDVRAADDARIPGLLDALSRAAARTVGSEDALWLLLVPDESDGPSTNAAPWPGFERHLPAEAALAVAVASVRGLDGLFAALYPSVGSPPETRPAASRLRLVGTFDHNGEVALDPPREETRAAGSGAPFDTGVVAVALDAAGSALGSVPVKTLRDFQPAPFVLLLPVAPEVVAVELRIRDQVLRRIPRQAGPPVLGVTVADSTLAWTYSHPVSVRPSFELEVTEATDGSLFTPALSLDPSVRSIALPLQRFPPSDGGGPSFRLVVSDGWNVTIAPVEGPFDGTGPLIARRVKSGVWWADTALDGTLVWALDGVEIGRGGLLTLVPPGGRDLVAPTKGVRTLTLTALDDTGAAQAVDTRVVEDPYA